MYREERKDVNVLLKRCVLDEEWGGLKRRRKLKMTCQEVVEKQGRLINNNDTDEPVVDEVTASTPIV